MTDEVCDPSLVPTIKTFYTQEVFSLYPNPASDVLQIDMEDVNMHDAELYMYDAHGGLIMRSPLEKGGNSLDIRELSRRMYFYIIHGDDGSYRQEGRFVKVEG